MATYESIIGSGTGNHYATVQLWYGTERSAPSEGGSYVDDDIVIAKLQNADDGHTGTHPIQYAIGGGATDVWDDVNLTIIISGTNPDRSEWSDPSCILTQNSYLKSNNSNKTFKYENLDLYADANASLRFNQSLTEADAGTSFDLEFHNCRIYCPSAGGNISITTNYTDYSSCEVRTKLVNCQVTPKRAFFRNNLADTGVSSAQIHRSIGCTFNIPYDGGAQTSIYEAPILFGGGPFPAYEGSMSIYSSGCIFETPTDQFFVYGPGSPFGNPCYATGVVVDFISSEATADFEDWALDRTNASSNITFNFGTAPGADEVSFASAAFDYSTDLPNLPLYDDANNLAKGFVSDVILPSPDLAGNSRGTSPFDAGAFELVGAVADTNVDIVLQVTPVNLY